MDVGLNVTVIMVLTIGVFLIRKHPQEKAVVTFPRLALLLPLMASCVPPALETAMASLLEYVGSVHIYLGPYRGNPIALYLKRTGTGCQIGPKVYPGMTCLEWARRRIRRRPTLKKSGRGKG